MADGAHKPSQVFGLQGGHEYQGTRFDVRGGAQLRRDSRIEAGYHGNRDDDDDDGESTERD